MWWVALGLVTPLLLLGLPLAMELIERGLDRERNVDEVSRLLRAATARAVERGVARRYADAVAAYWRRQPPRPGRSRPGRSRRRPQPS